ncbi:MAG: hypothetical protein HOQ32_17775 [Lysobacter sp.]|nr:hypothetical protein [Lysobacter sp.]
MSELFGSETARLRANSLDCGRDCLVVSFTPWSELPNPMGLGWAEKLCESRGWPALHVVPASNDWYQSDGALEAVRRAAEIARGYARVVTYGSSMGGYAALNFAPMLGASLAFAVVPQYSIDRAKVPFETRWAAEAGRIRFAHDRVDGIGRDLRAVLLYDPFVKADARHVDLIAEAGDALRVGLPLMGHAGPGSAILTAMLVLAREGRADEMRAHAVQQHRINKKRTANYYLQLANQARSLSLDARLRLLDVAKSIDATHVGIALKRSTLLIGADRSLDAIAVQDEALTHAAPAYVPSLLSHKAQALARLSCWDEALEMASQACERAPHSAYLNHHLAYLLLTQGRYREAERHQCAALALDEGNALYRNQLTTIRYRIAQEPAQADDAAASRTQA